MRQNVAGRPAWSDETHSKWIGIVVRRRGHGQANDNACPFIEVPWGQHQRRMDVAHFMSSLQVAVNPDDVLPIRRPAFFRRY